MTRVPPEHVRASRWRLQCAYPGCRFLVPCRLRVISIHFVQLIVHTDTIPKMLASLVTSPTLDLSSPLSRRKPSLGGSPSTSSAHVRNSSASASAHARTSSRSVDLAANLINNNTVARAAVAQEYANLRYREHCPLGMYVTPAVDNLLVWDAVLFVHRGAFCLHLHIPFCPTRQREYVCVCGLGWNGAEIREGR